MAKRKKKTSKKAKQVRPSRGIGDLPAWLVNRRLQAVVLFAVSCLFYANTLTHDYAQDDAIVLTENMFTTEGISGIPGILGYDTFYGFFKDPAKANLVAGGRYRPLSLVLFAIEVELFGLNPFVGHLVNVLLFALTAVVLYWLLLQLLLPEQDRAYAYFVALAGALLFAVHPLHTEVVANIKGRDEILALLGSLGALALSLRAYRRRQWWGSVLAALVFALALFAKENAITFLAVVPLAYYFFIRAKPGVIVRQSLPFFLAAVLFLAVRFSILGFGLAEPPSEMLNNPFIKVAGDRYLPFTTAERAATVTYTLGKYVQLLLFPHPLTHDYYPRQVGVMDWSDWQVWLSLLLYLGLIGWAIRGFHRKDPVSFGILYFLATLSIVSNILFPVGTHMSERFVYMPSVGYALVLAVLLYRLAQRRAPDGELRTFRQLYPALILAAGLVLAYGFRTVVRNPAWKNNYTLFSTDVVVSTSSAKLQNAMGGELITQATRPENETQRAQLLQRAVGHLQRAVAIHPNYKNAHLLLGNAYYYLERWEQAIGSYQRALQLDSGYEEAANNLAITYRDAGRFYGEQQGDLARALQYLQQAYQLEPEDYETLRLLGVAHGIQGNADRALEFFSKAVEREPENPDALYNLGSAYYNAGMPEQGQAYHQRAREIDPEVEQRMRGGD